MAKNIRVSDSLYRLAQLEARLESRSLAQQIEHWAKLGMAAATGHSGSLESALWTTRRSDILDVESGARQARDLHFVPVAIARESQVVGPRSYRKSKGG